MSSYEVYAITFWEGLGNNSGKNIEMYSIYFLFFQNVFNTKTNVCLGFSVLQIR